MLLAYGVWAVAGIFLSEIASLRLYEAVFTTRTTGARIKGSHYIIFQFLIGTHTELAMVGFICLIMGIVVAGFGVYHLALVVYNTTTNESAKWGVVAAMHDDAERNRAERIAERAERLVREGDAPNAATARTAAAAVEPPIPPIPLNSYASARWLDNLLEVLLPPSVHGRSAAWLAAYKPALDDDDAPAAAAPAARMANGGGAGSGGTARRAATTDARAR